LAHSNSCLSDTSLIDPLCDVNGTGSGILRRWDDAGHVGLSTAADPYLHRHGTFGQRAPDTLYEKQTLVAATSGRPIANDSSGQRQREIALLADLLAPYTGDTAIQMSSALIEGHGSIASLLVQLRQRLPIKVDLPGQAIARIEDLMSVLLHVCETEAYRGPVLSTSEALRRYLQIDMGSAPRENFRVLFLDAANHLLLDRVMWEGTVGSVQTHPREIVRFALLHNATALILAHNHPSGCLKPSREDITVTQNIINACRPLDICVHDHLIITRSGVASIMHK
jgi:DNA repair protein RadC